MNLIHSIEIRYFRSIHILRLDDLNNMAILSGRNDHGKSNILKALNLFFNGETEWRTPLVFSRDFNYKRLSEVRRESVKGKQFISVRITFNRGDRFLGSLPRRFSVTRRWFRDSNQYAQTDDLKTLSKRGELPGTLRYATRSLTSFLNNIRYEYVPAIKDERIFQHAIDELQKALYEASYESLGSVIDQVSDAVNQHVVALTGEFKEATGIISKISPPRSLEGLYKLSIDTDYAEEPGYSVNIDLRGDGIRTRYLPSILHHIAENSQKLYVWGFEEPENSLEYRLAEQMAQDFINSYAQKVQILVTSHSPAFIALRQSPNAQGFRVYLKSGDTRALPLKNHRQLGDASEDLELLHELGISQLQENLHRQYVEELRLYQSVKDQLEKLEAQHALEAQPVLLTEGKTDVQILKKAWEKLNPGSECPFRIEVCDNIPNLKDAGGSGGTQTLQRILEGVQPHHKGILLGLFDRDEAGLKSFGNLTYHKSLSGEPDVKVHQNGRAAALILPVAPGLEPFGEVDNLPIEYYFSEVAIKTHDQDGKGLILNPIPLETKFRGKVLKKEHPAELWYCSVHPDSKGTFANNVVPTLHVDEFQAFRYLFDLIIRVLSRMAPTVPVSPTQPTSALSAK